MASEPVRLVTASSFMQTGRWIHRFHVSTGHRYSVIVGRLELPCPRRFWRGNEFVSSAPRSGASNPVQVLGAPAAPVREGQSDA